jgi:hypothetical protein
MATSPGTSNLKKPWAWLAAIAVFGLVLASSTALYVVNPSVKMPLPWWTAVAAPFIVYALVLPLCVPRLRLGAWLAGLLTLAVVHLGIGLSTAWLYATVAFVSFEQALPPALWGFPPALVLAMVGSLVMILPFLGSLAPRAGAPRLQSASAPPRSGATKRARQAPPEIIPVKDRQAWARGPAGLETAAVAQVVSTLPAPAQAAPTLREPPPTVTEHGVIAPDEPAVHAAPLLGWNGGAPEAAAAEAPAARGDELPPVVVPDFRQALSELFGTPAAAPPLGAISEPPDELVPDELVAEPSFAEVVAAAPPVATDPVVRIPFDRVVGQLPPGAFRLPLGQVGARLREAEMLVVPQALIVPQLGEGVVQVAWEVVAEQFPAAVFAVEPAEVKERIVNGRLLLPLDEIVRQLSPDVFAASIGRGPVEVPGIEGFPAPFKPLGWEAPAEPAVAEPEVAPAPASPAPPPIMAEPEPVPGTMLERQWVAPGVETPAIETRPLPEPDAVQVKQRGNAEKLAALLVPWETAALDEVQVGDFAIVSVSTAGLAGGAVAAAAGRLSPVIARRAPRPVEQATLRGVGGTLVLTPVGSGWKTGTALAVGLRAGGALARLEILARRAAAAHDPPGSMVRPHEAMLAARLDTEPPPAAVAAAAQDLDAFGPLHAQSYREPASGALIHCFVPPGVSAAELAPFAWELAQSMAQSPQPGPLGSFDSAVLRSGTERIEIRRLRSTAGPAPVLVVGGVDTGRPGLARLQVKRVAARLGAA